MSRVAYMAAVVPILLLAACQGSPDLLTTLSSLSADDKQAAPAPDAKPSSKPGAKGQAPAQVGASAKTAPCAKDFWGSCKAPTPDKGQATSALVAAASTPPPAPVSSPSSPCVSNFWGSCKLAASTPDTEQAVLTIDVKSIASPAGPVAANAGPCAKDFWGTCKLVAVKNHVYQWHYARDGKKSEPDGRTGAEKVQPVSNAPLPSSREAPANSNLCHPRRRVVGEERVSRDDAVKSAESAWMGEVRYDFGERYQDLNKAKEVRHNCNPSTISTVLRTSQFRCAVEATPCRAPIGVAERR